MKNRAALIICILAGLVLVKPLFTQGFPETHDGQNHLARIANYYLAARQGQLPPRWAPNLDAGFGYPTLNFNYPLANLIALPMIAVNIPIEETLKAIILGAFIGGGVGMYLFSRLRFSNTASLISGILYMYTPYQLLNIYVRGNIGETLALALFPWVIYLLHQHIIKRSRLSYLALALVCSMFLLSHNLLALLSLPIFIAYTFSVFTPAQIRTLTAPAINALLIIAFFWIPALAEKSYIIIDQTPLNREFANHFPTFSQLVSSAWGYGYSLIGPVDGLSFQIGIFSILTIGLSIIILTLKQSRNIRWLYVFLAVFLLATVCMLSFTLPMWKAIPFLAYIQFPWRLLFFTSVSASIIAAWLIDTTPYRKVVIFICILYALHITSYAHPSSTFHFPDDHWFSFALTTTVLNENDPVWFSRNTSFSLFPDPHTLVISDAETTDISITSWTGTRHHYTIDTPTPTRVTEKTTYFPGWETSLDGSKIDLLDSAKENHGLISFVVPAGNSTIITRFTQKTPARVIGNSLTLLGLVSLLILPGRLTSLNQHKKV